MCVCVCVCVHVSYLPVVNLVTHCLVWPKADSTAVNRARRKRIGRRALLVATWNVRSLVESYVWW